MRGICLGIAAARYPIRINTPLAISALAVLILGNIYESVWPFSFLAALILILFLYLKLRESLRNSQFLQLIGHYSMLLFLWNGVVRVPFVSLTSGPLSQLVLGCLSAGVTFVIAFLIQEVVGLTPDYQNGGWGVRTISWSAITPFATQERPRGQWQTFLLRGFLNSSESGHVVIGWRREVSASARTETEFNKQK